MTTPLEIVPLGGLGEFGMNMLAVAWNGTAIVVDAGVLFPEPELLGVDLVIPDVRYLQQAGRVAALVLTHGHEDHIGALPHVIQQIDGPVFGTPFTLALAAPKLDAHGLAPGERLRRVQPGEVVEAGPFRIEFIRVTHSMPDCVALAIQTPVGTVVHSGDFKVDQTPLDGRPFDFHRFAALGAAGVLALLSDSTNADRKGVTGSERDVIDAFEEIFTAAQGKIIVAPFASSIYRMQVLVDLAEQFGRKVAFVGRGAVENSQAAAALGLLRLPPGLQIRESDVRAYPSQDVLCICTGSQGEPQSALARIAIDDHRHVRLAEGDVVVFSARAVPGNEKAIGRVMNHVARRGAEVIYEGIKHVHVSGHGSEEELKLMLALVRPKYFVPIHGEYRQLARHARLARHVVPDTTVLVAEDGDLVRIWPDRVEVAGKVPAGRVLIDGTSTGEVGDEILRDRRHLAADGVLVPVVAIGRQSGALEERPDVITRGVVVDRPTEELLREVPLRLREIVESASVEERTDPGLIKERIRVELQRLFRRRAGRRPLVVPVILEV
ncbi:MAG TPA: ribonuclease J [Vicinamibacterales bacterium]|nr:ribonuclease J [Vicinamibacterales bacterium]